MSKVWSSEYETGIPEIDTQNKKLVDYINALDSAKESGDSDVVVKVIESLLDHVCNQFMFEEHMMEEAGYEYHKAHEKVHEIFAKKLAELRGRVQAGESPYDEIISMLSHWVDGHVKNEDKMYAESVQVKIQQEGGDSWVREVMKKLFG